MPIYEYRCKDCGKVHEHLCQMGQSPKLICPDCKSVAYEKCLSAPVVVKALSEPICPSTGHVCRGCHAH